MKKCYQKHRQTKQLYSDYTIITCYEKDLLFYTLKQHYVLGIHYHIDAYMGTCDPISPLDLGDYFVAPGPNSTIRMMTTQEFLHVAGATIHYVGTVIYYVIRQLSCLRTFFTQSMYLHFEMHGNKCTNTPLQTTCRSLSLGFISTCLY